MKIYSNQQFDISKSESHHFIIMTATTVQQPKATTTIIKLGLNVGNQRRWIKIKGFPSKREREEGTISTLEKMFWGYHSQKRLYPIKRHDCYFSFINRTRCVG